MSVRYLWTGICNGAKDHCTKSEEEKKMDMTRLLLLIIATVLVVLWIWLAEKV